MTAGAAADVERELAALAELDRTALLQRWRTAFGRAAPPGLSRALMEKAIAYEVQVKAFGGLSARTKRSLRAAAKADGSSALRKLPSRGTRLVREWHGALHEVEVVENGYIWRWECHGLLSVIARPYPEVLMLPSICAALNGPDPGPNAQNDRRQRSDRALGCYRSLYARSS